MEFTIPTAKKKDFPEANPDEPGTKKGQASSLSLLLLLLDLPV